MKKKSLFRIRNNYQALLSGVITGIISLLAVICIIALILVKFDMPAAYVCYLWFIPSAVSGFISGGFSGRYVKSKGFLWGCLSASITGIISLSLLIFINSFNVSLFITALLPVFALTGAAGGILSANLK